MYKRLLLIISYGVSVGISLIALVRVKNLEKRFAQRYKILTSNLLKIAVNNDRENDRENGSMKKCENCSRKVQKMTVEKCCKWQYD